ncbi:hypothetical protein F5877DRAFT_85907 [Lentinula edodes]|nr:hypothetical protein F5877DRAFT_85907 [Lentinula edodes]
MTTSHTTTTTQPTASTSSHPTDPPRPGTPIDEDEDKILREALARVEKVKARKAAEAAKKKAAEEVAARKAEEVRRKKEVTARASTARRKAAQEARDRASQAQQQNVEVVERQRLLAEAATARSQRGTSPSEMLVSPRRPMVEIRREKGKGREEVLAQPVGEDLDDGNDGDEEEREPCERCKAKKIPCLKQAGKRSSVICKPCHDSEVQCSYLGRPYTIKREGGASPSGERLAVLESQMVQVLADNRALREANSKSHQYLCQLLRRQEDDHARLISMDTRMALMGMGEGPSRRTAKQWQRIVEESEEEEKEVEEKEKEVEKDGEGEEEETALTEARSEKGKERAVE